ncbi:Hypothetical protein HEAR2833 [Herminiimonas arsenicoxydans]|uniref:Uncharacterized protein n=1 Tax=Herminiimonas arsenicoxydans TaxID=204773 RepID=A4G8W0_HERAR|nr:Hypothetical protein HEAR2833 [Herminiimonas arsenicoxydans]
MMRAYTLPILLLLAACETTYTEADFKRTTVDTSECISGNCENGTGTRRYDNYAEYTGRWVDGKMVAGRYDIRWACQPEVKHPLTLDAQGNAVSGTMIRSCRNPMNGKIGRVNSFTGTFDKVYNPFTKEQINTYKSGKYIDGNGIVWEGEFDYIPVRQVHDMIGYGKTDLRYGSFVFIGAKIDEKLNEVVRGLYITEPVRPEQELRFIRARPDYLAKLRADFVDSRQQTANERAEEARSNREFFNTITAVAAGTVVLYGTARLADKANRNTMDTLTSMLKGQTQAGSPNAQLKTAPVKNAGASARTMTVAEYRRLHPASTTASGSATPTKQQSSITKTLQVATSTQSKNESLATDKATKEAERKRQNEERKAQQESAIASRKQEDENNKRNYLNAIKSQLQLRARHCPDGEGKHYVVGILPKIKPKVVSCIDVGYRVTCPGSSIGSSGTIRNFTGFSTDCYMGDTGEVHPTPSCKPAEAKVIVTSTSSCGG